MRIDTMGRDPQHAIRRHRAPSSRWPRSVDESIGRARERAPPTTCSRCGRSAELDGCPMSIDDINSELGLVIPGGAETTRTTLLARADPVQRAQRPLGAARRRPGVASRTRSRSCSAGSRRSTTCSAPSTEPTPRSTAWRMAAGDRVALVYPSANRDEAVFDRARRDRPAARPEPAHRLRVRHPLLPRRARRPARAAGGAGGADRPVHQPARRRAARVRAERVRQGRRTGSSSVSTDGEARSRLPARSSGCCCSRRRRRREPPAPSQQGWWKAASPLAPVLRHLDPRRSACSSVLAGVDARRRLAAGRLSLVQGAHRRRSTGRVRRARLDGRVRTRSPGRCASCLRFDACASRSRSRIEPPDCASTRSSTLVHARPPGAAGRPAGHDCVARGAATLADDGAYTLTSCSLRRRRHAGGCGPARGRRDPSRVPAPGHDALPLRPPAAASGRLPGTRLLRPQSSPALAPFIDPEQPPTDLRPRPRRRVRGEQRRRRRGRQRRPRPAGRPRGSWPSACSPALAAARGSRPAGSVGRGVTRVSLDAERRALGRGRAGSAVVRRPSRSAGARHAGSGPVARRSRRRRMRRAARGIRATGPMAGTPLDLAAEADVYRALDDERRSRSRALRAVTPTATHCSLERVDGDASLDGPRRRANVESLSPRTSGGCLGRPAPRSIPAPLALGPLPPPTTSGPSTAATSSCGRVIAAVAGGRSRAARDRVAARSATRRVRRRRRADVAVPRRRRARATSSTTVGGDGAARLGVRPRRRPARRPGLGRGPQPGAAPAARPRTALRRVAGSDRPAPSSLPVLE